MKTWDVYACSERIKRSNGIAADQVSLVAVERGPLDPCVPPENATRKVGTFLAASKADAIAEAGQYRRNVRMRGGRR